MDNNLLDVALCFIMAPISGRMRTNQFYIGWYNLKYNINIRNIRVCIQLSLNHIPKPELNILGSHGLSAHWAVMGGIGNPRQSVH